MRKYLISFALMMLNMLPAIANPHGKIYSVDGHGGSSGGLMIIVLIAIGLYVCFGSDKKNK